MDVSKILDAPGAEVRFTGEMTLPETQVGPQTVGFPEPIRLVAAARNVSEGILVDGQIDTQLRMTCARCLDEFTQPISVHLEEIYTLKAGGPEEAAGRVEGGKIDLEPIVYQNLLLEVPMSPLHSPDCAGLCPVCGANRNYEECPHKAEAAMDARWSALKDYFKKKA